MRNHWRVSRRLSLVLVALVLHVHRLMTPITAVLEYTEFAIICDVVDAAISAVDALAFRTDGAPVRTVVTEAR